MRTRCSGGVAAMLVIMTCSAVSAMTPGREVWLPAAARLGGWVTDLVVLNPGDQPAALELTWIDRDRDSRAAVPVGRVLAGGATLVLDDVVLGLFGRVEGAGAIRVAADREVVVSARIWNAGSGPGTRGQGFEGVPVAAAVTAGELTHIPGVAQDSGFRSNLFAVNPGTIPAVLRFELLDPAGTVLATSSDFTLPPWSAFYRPVTDLGGPALAAGTVRVLLLAGSAIVVGSRVDNLSLDPTTLEAWWRGGVAGGVAGRWHGTVTDPGGFLGGMVLAVSEDGTVGSVDLTFPSTLCGINFAADQTFDPPPGLAELSAGLVVQEAYDGGGSMRFTLRLSAANDAFSGVIEALGSGFSGSLAACNGSHPTDAVRLGRLAP